MRLAGAALIAAIFAHPAAAQGDECAVSEEQQLEAQALEWEEFDQTGGAAGSFRNLADAGCHREALIAYDAWLRNGPGYPDSRARGIGTFHRGQLFAMLGDNQSASELIGNAHREVGGADEGAQVWNSYIDGVLGWLRGDRTAISDAMASLRQADTPFARRQVNVLRGLRNCMRESYRAAMSARCRE